MNENNDDTFEGFDEGLVRRYEDMVKNNQQYFFDVHEFEELIDFYIESHDFKKAAVAVRTAMQQHPNASPIRLKNSQVLLDEGKPIEALKEIALIEQYESDNEDIYLVKATAYNLLGNYKEAVKIFDKAISLEKEDVDELLYNIGVTFESSMQYRIAINYFKRAIENNPLHLAAVYDLGYCYEKTGNLNKSEECFNNYLNEDPFAELVWFKLGGIFEKMEQPDKALNAYDYAISIEDTFSLAYLHKANLLINMGKLSDAIDVYEDFLEIEKEYLEVYISIGKCYEDLDMPQKAMETYYRALGVDNKFEDAFFNIGLLKSNEGLYIEAEKYIKKAIELDPENAEFLYHIGDLYLAMDKENEATQAYEKAVSMDAMNAQYWLSLAEVHFNEGNTFLAIDILENALSTVAEPTLIYYMLGVCYIDIKEKEKGLDFFAKGLEENYFEHLEFLEEYNEILNIDEISLLIIKNRP